MCVTSQCGTGVFEPTQVVKRKTFLIRVVCGQRIVHTISFRSSWANSFAPESENLMPLGRNAHKIDGILLASQIKFMSPCNKNVTAMQATKGGHQVGGVFLGFVENDGFPREQLSTP